MRTINKIIIHCSATKPTMDIGAAEIRKWHTDPKPRGNGWGDIGYHGVIRRNGVLESGRPMNIPGAHCVGQNSHSIGICMVGGINAKGKPESNFTAEQWQALERTVKDLLKKFPTATVHGHNEFANKACPSFDVRKWWSGVQSKPRATA
ncbi:N-acetylmuramoyl-L-alanine amidase [Desulfovibrio sp. OttesenSCG-928-G15]|nr:N-acetylmuramoyl-L-alanine amidase [Desulfovibrio sp. OttesenSCG-928-G15]